MTKFEFQPFDKVLVRNGKKDKWRAEVFSHKDESDYPYCCMGATDWPNCIPYNETTKHLCGTSDPYVDPAETPAFEFGDVVEIEIYKGSWIKAIFLEYSERGFSSTVLVNGSKESRVCRKNHNVRLIRKGNFND